MEKKYHPDKLQHKDETYRKGAENKFRKVQEAYEQLQKEKEFLIYFFIQDKCHIFEDKSILK